MFDFYVVKSRYHSRGRQKSSACRKVDFEDEEQRRIKEGAETLLNLAGITTHKRSNSNSYSSDDSKRSKKDNNTDYEKPSQFRPRLLRKKRDAKRLANNNNIVQADDEWVKHRRELEINGNR